MNNGGWDRSIVMQNCLKKVFVSIKYDFNNLLNHCLYWRSPNGATNSLAKLTIAEWENAKKVAMTLKSGQWSEVLIGYL